MGNNCTFCDGNDLTNQKNIESNCFVNRKFKDNGFERFKGFNNNGGVYETVLSPRGSDGSLQHRGYQ